MLVKIPCAGSNTDTSVSIGTSLQERVKVQYIEHSKPFWDTMLQKTTGMPGGVIMTVIGIKKQACRKQQYVFMNAYKLASENHELYLMGW